MLSESFVTSIRSLPKTTNTAISKDASIFLHDLYPNYVLKSSFKKSSTNPNCLAINATHLFAAQADKAVVHVYAREKGNQEALVSFPERIHSLELVNDGLLALGTAEGRIILWEVCTGRQVSTPTSHLQPVSCLASTPEYLISGSEDSNMHVWSVSRLLDQSPDSSKEPLRNLSNHRAAITSVAMGHGSTRMNICVSASKDNTCVVWNYHTGALLRTFLLPLTPLCVALDPCDRAVYIGSEDGSIQSVELLNPTANQNSLYDENLRSTPVQVASAFFSGSPTALGASLCLELNYDGTVLVSGHESGEVVAWDIGLKRYSSELSNLNAPVNNITFMSPFPEQPASRPMTVVKPRLGDSNYAFTAQFTTELGTSSFDAACSSAGIPDDLLQEAILGLSTPAVSSASGDAALRKENEDLWKIVNEQRALQKRTYDKFREAAP